VHVEIGEFGQLLEQRVEGAHFLCGVLEFFDEVQVDLAGVLLEPGLLQDLALLDDILEEQIELLVVDLQHYVVMLVFLQAEQLQVFLPQVFKAG